MLRRGNKASADYWWPALLPVIERYRICDIPKFFRGDAAFAIPAMCRLLEKEGYGYTIRIDVKVTRHSKYVTFQLTEVAVPRRLFAVILERITRLTTPPPSGSRRANWTIRLT